MSKRIQTATLSLTFGVCLALIPSSAGAIERAEIQAANTASPRDTLRSFIDACNEVHELIQREKFLDRDDPEHARLGERILDCIDTSEIPAFARKHRAAEVAVCIKEILDRVELPAWEDVPDLQAIDAAGGFEELSLWRIPRTRITIARVEDGPQKHEYLFSRGTVARAPSYFANIRTEPYRTDGPSVSEGLYDWYFSVPGHWTTGAIFQRLPRQIQFSRTLGMATWKWPGVLLTLLIGMAVIAVAYRLQWKVTPRARTKSLYRYYLTVVFPVVAMLVPLGFRHVIENYLTVRGTPLYLLSFLANLTTVVAAGVVIITIANRIAEGIIASPRIHSQGLNAQLIRIVSKLVSLIGLLGLFIYGGQYLGIPIGTLLASAGIGGVAVALGAQDTLKNLFATMALMADKPCRAGERIVVDKYEGVVEDIGLRSTKLRLLDGHMVTLPNEQIAGHDVENVSRRTHIRRSAAIHIPLDTSCEKVEAALAIVNQKLSNHERMEPDRPPRVFLEEFGPQAFRIRFYYWYTSANLWEFREFSSRLNIEIFRAFEEQGIQFSLPFRHTFWKRDAEQGPLDIRMMDED